MSEEQWIPISGHKRSDFQRFDTPVEVIGFDKDGNAWQGAAFFRRVPYSHFEWVAVKKKWLRHPVVHPTHFRTWRTPHKSTEEIVYRYFRITKDNASKQNSWPNWLLEAWNRPTDELYFVGRLRNRGLPAYGKLHISTKDGDIPVEWDHYIAIKPCGEIFTTDKIPFNSKGEA